MTQDEKYMAKALHLAKKGVRAVSPNPMVGAVIVKGNEIVGRGWHERFGGPHAEISALKEAGTKARGSSLYVSLEPCSTEGKTPPCVKAILDSGIRKVYIGALDPNPLHHGKSIALLRNAGVETCQGIRERDAEEFYEPFAKHVRTGLPFVAIKLATTLDGKIATRTGDSKWVTGMQARREVHRLRNMCDAIMVGHGTVKKDDPQLTVCKGFRTGFREPLRAVMDSNCRIASESKLLSGELAKGTVVFYAEGADERNVKKVTDSGATAVCTRKQSGRSSLDGALAWLGERGILSVLIEGGGVLAGAAFEQSLVDKVYWFIAPKIVGGSSAPTGVEGVGFERMSDAVNLERSRLRRIGKDWLVTGYVRKRT